MSKKVSTKVEYKKLPDGVHGMTYNSGRIEINKKLSPVQQKIALSHEKVHRNQIKKGELRYDEKDAPIDSFVLNQDKYKDSQILITGKNFGCGSSREHAPWSILDYGIKCIIASSFADIFYNNCFKNGILPIKLDESEVTKLQKAAENSLSFTIDLENQKISYFDKNINHEVSFELDKAKKTSLLEGLDDIGLTLAKVNHISDFENKQKSRTPWLYSQQIK